MNKRLMPYTAAAVFAALATASTLVADTTVPQYERESVHVASGTTAFTGALSVADNARLVKSGNGAATLDKESIVTPNAPNIDVLDGSLTIGSNGGTPVAVAEPTAILDTASLWLAADVAKAHFETSTSGDDTVVDVWRDVRDTDASATNYPYAATPLFSGFVSPVLATDSAGNRSLYFKGFGSKCTMLLLKADGTSYAAANQKLSSCTVFAVTRIVDYWGHLLGNYTGYHCYQTGHPAYSTGTVDASYHAGCRNPQMRAMRFFDNGESRDTNRDKVRTGLRVLEWCHSAKAKGGFDSLFGHGKTQGYEGGDYLMELVVFGSELSESDRLAIEAYLAAKWDVPSPGANLRVASGAAATITTSGLTVSLSGEGDIETTASGNTFAADDDGVFGGSLTLANGVSATIAGSGVPISLAAGDSLDVSGETASLSNTAAADTVEKTGTGVARLTALPANVLKFDVKCGRVILAAPVADAMPDADGSAIDVTISHHGFETSEPRPQWSWNIAAWNGNSSWPIAAGKNSNNMPTQFDAPEGSKVFVLARNSSSAAGTPWAQTTVSVPVTGRYELTFFGGGRPYDYGLGLFRVLFISGATTNECDETDGYHVSTGFMKHRVLTPVLTAGDWTMRIQANFDSGVPTSAVDDFRMKLVTEDASRGGAWRLPNGGFEDLERHASENPSYWYNSGNRLQTSLNQPNNAADNKVERWTFTQSGSGTTGTPSVGLVDDAMFFDSNTSKTYYGNPFLNGRGKRFIGFWSNGGTATSAPFTPPAGAWKVRFKAAFAGADQSYNLWHSTPLPGNPQWRVTVAVNGASAMTATSSTHGFNKWADVVPDGSFTVAEGDTVTVSIEQTVATAAGYIDEVELIPADFSPALAASAPDLPARLSVEVESGAQLALDFAGTIKLGSLKLGSRYPSGTVSASTHPDFISGTGAFEVPARATFIYMR